LEDALAGFTLVPNWLKLAMEQDQPVITGSRPNLPQLKPFTPLISSPSSFPPSSADPLFTMSPTPHLNLRIPGNQTDAINPANDFPDPNPKIDHDDDDEDRRYWEQEEDEGYLPEMEDDEDLEEVYRSVF